MHKTVFLKKVIEIVKKISNINTGLDVTYGGGGHSKALSQLGIKMTNLDKDFNIENVINDSFDNFDLYINEVDITIADLGLSNMQLNEDRGFSYLKNSNLDMRMKVSDYTQPFNKDIENIIEKKTKNIYPLWEVIKFLKESQIAYILKNYGELKNYKQIAKNIYYYQLKKEIKTTFDLVVATDETSYKKLSQIFQAFRIFINNEHDELHSFCRKIKYKTKYLIIITFNSLEDKIVRKYFKKFTVLNQTYPMNANLYYIILN